MSLGLGAGCRHGLRNQELCPHGRQRLCRKPAQGPPGARRPEPETGAVAFRLGQEVDPNQLKGAHALVLVHDEDLGRLVQGCLAGRVPAGVGPITVVHEQGWELKEIVAQIARALGKRVTFVPVPWQFVWLGLKGLELAGARPNFRSDSLISMVYQNPLPSFASRETVAGLPVPAISVGSRDAGPADGSVRSEPSTSVMPSALSCRNA